MKMPAKKMIAVSSCLLGHKVRYDGNDKRSSIVENELCTRFHCVSICPDHVITVGNLTDLFNNFIKRLSLTNDVVNAKQSKILAKYPPNS